MKPIAKKSGFTLVELLVVITIISVLSIVGLTLFSSAQKGARDARRRADIDAIVKALEINKSSANSATYNVLDNNQFTSSSGVIPVDSQNNLAKYCLSYSTALGVLAPDYPTTWVNTSACPTTTPTTPSSGAGYTAWATISNANPPATSTVWTACALFELGSNPTNIYCRKSSQ